MQFYGVLLHAVVTVQCFVRDVNVNLSLQKRLVQIKLLNFTNNYKELAINALNYT